MSTTRLPFDVSHGVLSRGRRYAWIAILALSPAAYFGAAALENRLPHQPKATIERERAIAIARQFAAGRLPDTAEWSPSVQSEDNDAIATALERTRTPGIDRIAAAKTVQVKLTASTNRWITVHLTPAGRVVGFDSSKPDKGSRPIPPEDGARTIAEQYLRAAIGSDSPFDLRPGTAKNNDKTGWRREFVWQAPLKTSPPAKATFRIEVTGDRVTGDSRSIKFDNNAGNALRSSMTPWRIAYIAVLVIFYVGFAIYAIVRYVRRSIEKEISHRRTLLVTAAFLVVGTVLVAVSNQINVSTDAELSGGAKMIVVWASIALTFSVIGLFLGVAYGAGEGDLREAYPGKLIALDAFLSGKIFSANFARSLLAGVAAAGWVLLIQNVLLLPTLTKPLSTGNSDIIADHLPFPLLTLFVERIPDIAMVIGYGLMLPLTLLRSRVRKPWLLYLMVFILCALGSRGAAPDTPQWQIKAAIQFLLAAAACLPFFFGDLAASISAVMATVVVGELMRLSVTSPDWHHAAYGRLLPFAIVFLAVELYYARRGRVYDEAEVRPLYAKHLALRQSLSAEIGAARTAQLRLLPDAPPRIAGLTIAGSCTPAREVGGDFFDYYALDDHRVGVFVAEGGNRELGSAMTIALAKGFLMYTARLDLAPVEILRRLRATLATVVRGEATAMSVLYAVIDGHSGLVRYARAGSSPRLLLNGNALAEEIGADGDEIRHGAAQLAPHDSLVFFTDGLALQAAERTHKSPEQFFRDLRARFAEAGADELHVAMLDTVLKRAKEAPPDDVTAVVVCRQSRATEALEGIA
jgi:serine phosphatase RsbU (regulator of sigma subunit)